jgi:hypothetical protein
MKSPSIPTVSTHSEDVKARVADNVILPEDLSKLSIASDQIVDSLLTSLMIQ